MSRPGKAPTSAKALSPGVCLARGMSRPGKAPTSGSPEVLCPHGTQGFGTSPRTGLPSGKLPTRLRCLPCAPTGSYFLNTQVGRVSNARGFTSTFRTLPNILCGLRKQAPQSTKSLIRSLILFRISRITLRTSNTTLFTTPDNYITHIYNFKYSPDESHNSSY